MYNFGALNMYLIYENFIQNFWVKVRTSYTIFAQNMKKQNCTQTNSAYAVSYTHLDVYKRQISCPVV